MYSVTTSKLFWDSVVIFPLISCLYFHFDGQSHLGEKVQHFIACACKKKKLVLVSLLWLHSNTYTWEVHGNLHSAGTNGMNLTPEQLSLSPALSFLLQTISTDVSLWSSAQQVSLSSSGCCWSDQKCVLPVYLIGSTQSPLHASWNRLFPHSTQVNVHYYQSFYWTAAVIQGGKRSWVPSWTTHRHSPKFPIRKSLQMTGGPLYQRACPDFAFKQVLCLTVLLLIHSY